jgi:hypothetical protein
VRRTLHSFLVMVVAFSWPLFAGQLLGVVRFGGDYLGLVFLSLFVGRSIFGETVVI